MYAWYPNPFYGLNSDLTYMKEAEDLMLLDGTENGQVLPLASLVQPSRKVDFTIAWDDNLDKWYRSLRHIQIDTAVGYPISSCPFGSNAYREQLHHPSSLRRM